jgi:DnaJ homolog subfamily C member 28
MESSIATFRNILQSAWIRRATRSLPLSHGYDPSFPFRLTASYLSNLRDVEWEERERGYHEHAIGEVNSFIRKYNGIAPYTVRRGLLTREDELKRCYEGSGERILEELRAMNTGASARSIRNKTQQDYNLNESKEPSLWQQLIQALRSFLRLQA